LKLNLLGDLVGLVQSLLNNVVSAVLQLKDVILGELEDGAMSVDDLVSNIVDTLKVTAAEKEQVITSLTNALGKFSIEENG